MKIRISKKTKRIFVVYLAILVILYIVIYQIPKVTDAFETTQVLENGTLEVSCETTGYLVKEEAVCTADKTGKISYSLDSGTVVKKGTDISSIEPAGAGKQSKAEISEKYKEDLRKLRKYDMLIEENTSPISGVFSTSMDGNERYFSISNLDNITKEKTENRNFDTLELDRTEVTKGEPIFKISSDENWYIVCWVEKSDAKKYDLGEKVRITLPDSTVDAKVYSKNREGEFYKMVFYLNVYYDKFSSARRLDITVVQSNTAGLIVDNECIVRKNGVEGVYVKTKDDDTYFMPIKVKTTDGKQSVIYESIFINDDYEQVETVSVYQEVLRNPQEALENDMKNGREGN